MDSWNFDVLLIIRSPSALGIEAASFASFSGQRTTDNGQREFLNEVEFKRAKI